MNDQQGIELESISTDLRASLTRMKALRDALGRSEHGRQASVAVTKLEETLLWLHSAPVLA